MSLDSWAWLGTAFELTGGECRRDLLSFAQQRTSPADGGTDFRVYRTSSKPPRLDSCRVFLLLFSLRLHFHPSIHPSTQVGMDRLYYSSCCWIWAFICWFVWSCRVVFSAREITQVSLSLSLLMFTGMLLSLSKCLHSYPVSATSCTCLHW
jgi:hypothetical protein